jgi:signal transduction histidine kinase
MVSASSSHEMMTPINSMIGNLQLLIEKFSEDQETKIVLEVILAAAQLLESEIQNMIVMQKLMTPG